MLTEVTARVRAASLGSTSLIDAAYGCRAGGLDPVECAPILFAEYAGTNAQTMATALSLGWCGIINSSIMTSALQAAGYNAGDIATALSQVLHLNWLDNVSYTNPSIPLMPKVHGLYLGNLANLSPGEMVDFLVVSCLPGDYAPTPGSLIGALNGIGVSVQQLSNNKAADYRTQYNCWVSQPVPNQQFTQLIVFESTGANAPTAIPGIFQALKTYMPNPHAGSNYPYVDIASPLVSTGGAGGNMTAVMTALFNAAKGVLNSSYNLGCLRLTLFTQAEVNAVQPVFDSLKS
jgi:hypothetical protein